jgi:Domain of unknown function (DUF4062)
MVHFIKKRLQVFVSSTYLDLKEERQAAVKAILESEHIPAGMELFTSGDESQMDVIKQWIRSSDVYLLILGGRYGSLEPISGKSYTHLEYEYAIELGKPLFACVMKDTYLDEKIKNPGVKSKEILEQDNQDKLKEFKKSVMSKMVSQCNSFLEIENSILKKMAELSRDDKLIGWIRSDESSDSKILSEEVARLSKENHELRQHLQDIKAQDKSSNLAINGIRFDEIVKILGKIILCDEDFIPAMSKIQEVLETHKRIGESKWSDTGKPYVIELTEYIKLGKISNALDLINLLSSSLLNKMKAASDKQTNLARFYGIKSISSGLSDAEFDNVCMHIIFSIPKLQILFEFDILVLREGDIFISSEGKNVVKYIKSYKAKLVFESENLDINH